jgi:putative ABC transport system permease protein
LRITDLFKLAFHAMSDRKLRTGLTILGIVIGPATIVALVSATQGFSNGVTGQFNKLGSTSIFVSSASKSFDFTSLNIAPMQNLPGVKSVLPFWLINGAVKQGTQTTAVQVMAIDLSSLPLVLPGLDLQQGALPTSGDLAGSAIGASIANPGLAGAANLTINQVVSVSFSSGGGFGGTGSTGQKSFIIRGVFSSFGQGFFINPDDGVFVPLSEGQSLLHTDKYTGVIVVATNTSVVNTVLTELSNQYGQDIRATAVTSILQIIQTITGGIGTILASVAGISVLVAFIGIMTTMFTTVVERTKEIGVMKAIGYSSKNILSVFFVEALLTGLIGGIIGASAGGGMGYLIVLLFGRAFGSGGAGASTGSSRTAGLGGGGGFGGGGGLGGGGGGFASGGGGSSSFTITPVVSPELIILAIGLATLVGAIAGLLPAWRASRLSAVDALRSQ